MAQTQKRETRELDDRRLWDEFRKTGDAELRNQLVERYLAQVKYAADRLAARLPAHADIDDLAQTGVFGLMDAIERFDPTLGVRFETYCQQRITGSMLDGIRAADWVPRLVRSQAHQLEKVLGELECELGREPSDYEVAARLGIDLEEYDKLLLESNIATIVSYSRLAGEEDSPGGTRKRIESIEDRNQPGPLDEVSRRELLETMARSLSKKERLVVILYYYEKFTFKEIGEVLDVSESRVCQIHSKVIVKLKARLARAKSDLLAD